MAGHDIDLLESARRALAKAPPPNMPTREELTTWGRALGALLPRPAVLTLSGDLGAGKTTLARALCEGLGVLDMAGVTSPTYALLQEYLLIDGYVVHADLYRLRSNRELYDLGWDDLLASAPVLLVEWPERALASLPRGTIQISLGHDPDDSDKRSLTVGILDRLAPGE